MPIERNAMAKWHNCKDEYKVMKISRRRQNTKVVLRMKLDWHKDERIHNCWFYAVSRENQNCIAMAQHNCIYPVDRAKVYLEKFLFTQGIHKYRIKKKKKKEL